VFNNQGKVAVIEAHDTHLLSWMRHSSIFPCAFVLLSASEVRPRILGKIWKSSFGITPRVLQTMTSTPGHTALARMLARTVGFPADIPGLQKQTIGSKGYFLRRPFRRLCIKHFGMKNQNINGRSQPVWACSKLT
jgi:hypothetical protein